jgi:multidrug efflux system membrane fusion protein
MRQTLASQQANRDSGLPVTLLRRDGSAYESEGRILFSGINVDAGTGDVLLRILVDNAQRDLLPGMFVRARVPRASYADALLVPQQAVSRIGGTPHVWVVGDGDRVYSQPVVLGELVEHRYRIQEGLKNGQRVVVEGVERLSEGAIVAPRDWHPPNTATR